MRRVMGSLVVFTFVVVLAGCGSSAASTDQPGSVGSPFSSDLITQISGPSDQPTTPALPALISTVTSRDGVTISYPDGWEPPIATIGVFVYNNKDAELGITLQNMRPGTIYFQLNPQPAAGKTLAESFDFSFNAMAQGLNIPLGEKQTQKVGEQDVIKATGNVYARLPGGE